MKNSRRGFLKIAGVSALGIGAKPVFNAFASGDSTSHEAEVSPQKNALTAKRWGMVIDSNKIDKDVAHKIMESCNSVHNIPTLEDKRHEVKWVWEDEFNHVFPEKEDEFLAEKFKELPFMVLCNHCKNPPCVRACPTQATFQREDGIVLMDFHRCIGCRFCMAACPYGSRSFNFRDPRPFIKEQNPDFPTRMKGVVEKCNFCAERLAEGKLPACVESSGGAIAFGDLDDPASTVRELLRSNYTIRRKQNLGTGPSVYYIV